MRWRFPESPFAFSERCCGAAGVSKSGRMRRFTPKFTSFKFSRRVVHRNRWVAELFHQPFEPPRTDFSNQSAASLPLLIYLFDRPVGFSEPHFIFQTSRVQFGAPRQVQLSTYLRGCCLTSVAPDSTSHVLLHWFFH